MNIITGHYDEGTGYGAVALDGKPLHPKRSQKLFNHSPDGFSWGYSGSGPAQLALAILLEAGLPPRRALKHYHHFKAEFLAPLDRDNFTLEVDIAGWVERREQETEC